MRINMPTAVCAAFAAVGLLHIASANAGSLSVSPVTIEVPAADVAAVAKVQNPSASPATAQLRVFRWTQVDGVEKLEPSDDVVVSPPLAQLAPGAEQTIRIMLAGGAKASSEQSYRLFVDELPPPRSPTKASVAVVVRLALPVFFGTDKSARSSLDWRLDLHGSKPALIVSNEGGRRARIANLVLRDKAGNSVEVARGLAGYVLSRSIKRFELPRDALKLAHGSIAVSAQSDLGPINAMVK